MSNDGEINIKHRLTGAAILIALGVIIIPLLLGSYTSKDSETVTTYEKTTQSVGTIENTSFKNVESEDIKVFVSKIRPADSEENNIVELSELIKQKPVEKEVDSASEEEILQAKLAEAMNKPLIKKKETSTWKSVDSKQLKKVSTEKLITKKVTASPVKKATAPIKKTAAPKPVEKRVVKAPAAVKEGYIVSVGVYSKPTNASNVMKRLVDNGFNPTQRVVKTSKGPLPRVWLGPFATRAEAGKKKQLLTKRLGKLGAQTLIKRYP